MDFYTSLGDIPADFGPSAVTFGKFDGVHRGHRGVLSQLFDLADARGLVSTVLSFDRNPLSVLAPEKCPESVISNAQKRELLAATGVDTFVELAFDEEFSRHSAADFVERIIVGTLHAAVVLVGDDTRYGAGGSGSFATLQELGAAHEVEVVRADRVRTPDGEIVSSTRIRTALAAGDVRTAAELLGRTPCVRAEVVHGKRRGRELGYPTANLSPQLEGLIPADGVYAGYLVRDGIRMPAAISIGNNPTFEGVPARQVEAYVIDEDLDLYDQVVEVEFVERIRGMLKFDSIDELIERMAKDTDAARMLVPR